MIVLRPFLSLLLLIITLLSCVVVVVVNAQSTAAGQETLIGIVGRDFVLLGADSSISTSISLTASMDKIAVLVNPYEGLLDKEEGGGLMAPVRQQQQQQQQDEDDRSEEVTKSDNNNNNGDDGERDTTTTTTTRPRSTSSPLQQQCIVAAAAGDAADADRLLSGLTAQAAIAEYESSIGCDVDVIDCTKYIQEKKKKKKHSKKKMKRDGSSSPPPPPPPPPRVSLPAGLSVHDVAQLARTFIAQRMRKKPLNVCLLVGGMMPIIISTRGSTFVVGKKPPATSTAFVAEQVQWQVRKASEQLMLASTTPSSSDDDGDEGLKDEDDDNYIGGPDLVAVDGEDEETSSSEEKEQVFNNNNNNSLALEPRLYWLDEYGALRQVQYGAHGLASMFCSSILDKSYQPGMTRKQALALMRDCFSQLRTRYVVNNSVKPCIKCVDASGCRIILEHENE